MNLVTRHVKSLDFQFNGTSLVMLAVTARSIPDPEEEEQAKAKARR